MNLSSTRSKEPDFIPAEIEKPSIQDQLLAHAQERATAHGFHHFFTSHFYLFDENIEQAQFSVECDILDMSPTRMALECYLYHKYVNRFVAKLFVVYGKVL